jgi:tRNA-dihydrouridine synthase A
MMEITNIHFRFFVRLLTRRATLWTEMEHENTILHTSLGVKELLKFYTIEHPIVLQLGGNVPDKLAQCVKYAAELGYDEVNLNCGCPSAKV